MSSPAEYPDATLRSGFIEAGRIPNAILQENNGARRFGRPDSGRIGTEDETRAAATAAERYWQNNTIRFTQTRAWRHGFDDGITVPDKLRKIQALWAEWAAVQRQGATQRGGGAQWTDGLKSPSTFGGA